MMTQLEVVLAVAVVALLIYSMGLSRRIQHVRQLQLELATQAVEMGRVLERQEARLGSLAKAVEPLGILLGRHEKHLGIINESLQRTIVAVRGISGEGLPEEGRLDKVS